MNQMQSCSRATLAVACLVLVTTTLSAQWQMETVLHGASVVPPVVTTASGVGVFTLNEPAHTLTYYLVLINVFGTTAELHLGAAGANGPLRFTLSGGPVAFEGTTGPLTPAEVITLHEEGFYVVASTPANPGGETRGQLQPVKKTYHSTALDGSQVVPPNSSLSTASGTLRLNEPDGVVVFDIRATGVALPAVANIRIGPPGSNGPLAVTLPGENGHFCGVSEALSPTEAAALVAGNTYLSIESATFPNGEIRGPIIAAHAAFSLALGGSHVVPPVMTAASGLGSAEFDPLTATLSYQIEASGLSGPPLGAAIRRGPDGAAGPLVVALSGGPTMWTGITPPLTPAQVDDLYRARLYVDVATSLFPNGEIRAQIRPDPYLFGVGGVGTNGVMKVSANGYLPSHRANVTIAVANTWPAATAYLLLGTSSSFSALLGQPLPLPLPPAGNLWVDVDPAFFLPVQADAIGCASLTFDVPADTALRGLRAYVQFASTDPGAIGGVVLSDALEFTILP